MIVHLFSGDAAAGAYRAGGGKGEIVVWREALVAGPLRDGPGWLETRASFLAAGSGREVSHCRQDLAAQELAISAALDADELVLWFARDLFCELGLLRVLAGIGTPRRAALWLVCPKDSGTTAFPCFGALPPHQVAALATLRRPLGDADVDAATAAWTAITSADPTQLDRFLSSAPDPAPLVDAIARDAVTKQRARFPSFVNGLGRTEHLALELLAGGATSIADLLDGFARRLPAYGWTDAQIASELAALARPPGPLVDLGGAPPTDLPALTTARLTVTPLGLSVLGATWDRVDACGIDTWIGGVHLTPAHLWRFDTSSARMLGS